MSLRRSTLALALALALRGGPALADTPLNGWDAARDPGAAARYALHVRVQQILLSSRPGGPDSSVSRARTLLEQAHAAESPDVRLRFDLGVVYAAPGLGDNVKAIEVLQPALDSAPDHPAAVSAFIALANAYAKLDESEEERRVYERFLPKVTDERARSTAMLNLAEAHMHLGDLEASIAGYRATIDLAAQLPNMIELNDHTGALAVWGLAVALDRANDTASAAKETQLALVLDREMGIIRLNPSVFFVPERERNWYVALGFTEYAKQAEDARSAALWWARAEGCWKEYVQEVVDRGEKDRWVDLARARLDRAHAQRVATEKRTKARLVYPQEGCVR